MSLYRRKGASGLVPLKSVDQAHSRLEAFWDPSTSLGRSRWRGASFGIAWWVTTQVSTAARGQTKLVLLLRE